MTKIRLLIVTLFAFLLFIPLVGCSHDSSGGSDEENGSYAEKESKVQPSYSSSHLVDFVWTSESGETFTFYDDGTYCYDGDSGSWGTYKKDTNGNFTLTGEDGSGFYFEISGDSATVYETENGKKKEGAGISFEKINPSCCTVAEAAKYISVLTGDTTYTFIVVDDSEASCSALKTALNGLSSTESVGPYVSLNLTGATQLNISANAFEGTSSSNLNYALREIILPEECDSIKSYAFRYQAGLQNVVFPKNLTKIWGDAFVFTSITSIDISNTQVTEIGDYAFSSSSLVSIELPRTLKTIEKRTFSRCTYLKSIDLSGTQIAEIPNGSNTYSSYGSAGMFAECTSLTTVKLPTNITKIGDYAFRGCKNLTSINLSECTRLESIGENSFYECTSLENINLSGCTSLTTIGNDAFYYCNSPTSVSLPTSLKEIGYFAFLNCSATNIIINPTEGMAWGHSKEKGRSNSVDEPTSESLDMVEDFEEYAAYYLTGKSSAKGSVALDGYYYYWYKVPYKK